MSSANDTYHHLLVQTQPKSILKKSPSPRFLDSKSNIDTLNSSINFEHDDSSNIILSSNHEDKKNDIDENRTSSNHVCILNDNQSVKKNNSNFSPVEKPLTKLTNQNLCQYEIDSRLIRTIPPPVDSSSSSPLASDDEQQQQQQQQRSRIKSKKNYYRPFVATVILSSSASSTDNDERKSKRSMEESKITLIRSSNHRQKDMQLDEFMRKYQHQGGIYLPAKNDHDKEHILAKDPINNNGNHYPQSASVGETINLLQSIDTLTLSSKMNSPLQLLFDVARASKVDRRTKIDKIRQYVEEQIGISAFLTIYKLIKSSQIPIDIREKPFFYYANYIPLLCCLIMLENEQQKINKFS